MVESVFLPWRDTEARNEALVSDFKTLTAQRRSSRSSCRRLATKYNLHTDYVAAILRKRGLLQPKTARRTAHVPYPHGLVVYFVRVDAPRALVRIGTTARLAKQLEMLQAASPIAIYLAGAIRGTGAREVERELHELLAAHRSHGEWFKWTSKVHKTLAPYLFEQPIQAVLRPGSGLP